MRVILPALLSVALIAFLLPAQERKRIIRPLPTYNDALALAWLHCQTLPIYKQYDTRYVFITSGTAIDRSAVSLCVNQISQGSDIVKPDPYVLEHPEKGTLRVVALDLSIYAPRNKNRYYWQETYDEEMLLDPAFSIIVPGDQAHLTSEIVGSPDRPVLVRHAKKEYLQRCAPYTHPIDGNTYEQKHTFYEPLKARQAEQLRDVVVIKALGDHIDADLFGKLAEATQSHAPIVTSEYFLFRSLSAIEGVKVNKLFAAEFGGLYYRFKDIQTGFKKGTDLDNFLVKLGIGSIEQGIGYDQFFDDKRSDHRSAVFRSKVTGGPRAINIAPTQIGEVTDSIRIFSITDDIQEENVDFTKHPLYNLNGTKPDAHEGIYTDTNALHTYVLFNGAGARQDEAPIAVASDRGIPSPYPPRLQPAISCIRCHEAEDEVARGWKVLENDALGILKRLDILAEAGHGGRSYADQSDRFARRYRGNPESSLFPQGRNLLAKAYLKATGPLGDGKKGLTDAVRTGAQAEVEMYRKWWYDGVDAQAALRDFRLDVPKEHALTVFRRLLPPDPEKGVPYIGISENQTITGIADGKTVNRKEWAIVQGPAMRRAKNAIEDMIRAQKK